MRRQGSQHPQDPSVFASGSRVSERRGTGSGKCQPLGRVIKPRATKRSQCSEVCPVFSALQVAILVILQALTKQNIVFQTHKGSVSYYGMCHRLICLNRSALQVSVWSFLQGAHCNLCGIVPGTEGTTGPQSTSQKNSI